MAINPKDLIFEVVDGKPIYYHFCKEIPASHG